MFMIFYQITINLNSKDSMRLLKHMFKITTKQRYIYIKTKSSISIIIMKTKAEKLTIKFI